MKAIKLSGKAKNVVIGFVLLFFASCASISPFDQYAYVQTTSVKVDALNIMDLAKEEYTVHKKSVQELQSQLQKIYEYEKNRPQNEITLKLWNTLLDANGHLLGGFLYRWKNEQHLNEVYIVEAKKLVDKAFDQIAGLESKKIKYSDVSK